MIAVVLVCLILGYSAGFGTAALFNAYQYDKGVRDERRRLTARRE